MAWMWGRRRPPPPPHKILYLLAASKSNHLLINKKTSIDLHQKIKYHTSPRNKGWLDAYTIPPHQSHFLPIYKQHPFSSFPSLTHSPLFPNTLSIIVKELKWLYMEKHISPPLFWSCLVPYSKFGRQSSDSAALWLIPTISLGAARVIMAGNWIFRSPFSKNWRWVMKKRCARFA